MLRGDYSITGGITIRSGQSPFSLPTRAIVACTEVAVIAIKVAISTESDLFIARKAGDTVIAKWHVAVTVALLQLIGRGAVTACSSRLSTRAALFFNASVTVAR